jgi:C-terminal processing protease CtpA/Prc
VGESDRTAQVARVCELVTENYVFPKVAGRVVAVLREQADRGRYAGLDDEAFAAAVTEDLQSVNGDKHLRLLYRAQPLAEGEQPFDLERYRADAELQAHGFTRVERLPGNVGLCEIRVLVAAAIAGPAATAALTLLAHTDALIIDLRRCPGGDPAQIALICSYLFDEPTHLNDIYDRTTGQTAQFWTLPYVPGARFGGSKPVHVLTSCETFSGAEELAYNLQTRDRATVIGERSRGGAHPSNWYRVAAHLQATVPYGRAVNPVTGTNWEGTGVQPDIEVPADQALDRAYRLALEHVLTLGEADMRRAIAAEAREALATLPAAPDPGAPDPGAPDPGVPDPGAPDPGAPDPGAPDPGVPGSGVLDPAPAGSRQ